VTSWVRLSIVVAPVREGGWGSASFAAGERIAAPRKGVGAAGFRTVSDGALGAQGELDSE